MKKFLLFTLMFWTLSGFGQGLFISEVADPGDHYDGRYVELYNASGSAIDFSTSVFYLSRQSNGGTTWSDVQLTGTVANGSCYVIAGYSAFTSYYTYTPDITSGTVNGNGDDAYYLYIGGDHTTGTLVDIYGVIDQDGTGQPWEYADSHAVRNTGIVSPNTTWTASEWTITSANVADMTPGTHDIGSLNDQTSTVKAPGTQLLVGTISSIGVDSVPIIRFDITDAGGDGLSTNVTGMYFVAGPNNTVDFQQNLGGGGVYDLTNGAVVSLTGQPVVNSGNVFLPVNLTVPDGGTVSLEAYVYIDNANAPDGGILQFQINAANHGFTADASGSDFESTFAGGDIVGNNFTVQVVATQLSFIQQPSDVTANSVMTPAVTVAATDAGGNIDIDYASTAITLGFTGTGNMSGTNPVNTISGVATFNDLSFDAVESNVTLTANDGTFSQVTSAAFNVTVQGGGTSCADALAIDAGTHTAVHTTVADYDQWYVYTAAADGTITVENCSSGYTGDTYVEIIENNCGGTNWNSADNVCGTLETLSFTVTAGESYYIGWGDYDTANPGTYDWTLSFRPTINIIDAYAVSNNELVLKYESGLTSVDPADYTLTATSQTTVNFNSANIDAGDNTIVYLTASADFAINTVRDNINDSYNNTTYQFYAGVLPVSYTNTANDPDTVRQGYNVTLSGVVTANDNFNQVWIQDSNDPMSGVLIYSSSFDALVSVGDTVTITGQKAFYNGLTEIINPVLINSVSGGTPTPAVINTANLEYYKAQDDPAAEPWEGQLVTVSGIVIDSLNSTYFEYFGHDCSGNIICINDDVDYQYGSGFALTTGSVYSITGVVTYSNGHYKINPRGTSDATETVRDFTSLVEDPASQVADATIDGTVPVDSLNAIEAFKFKITDEGTDGLPTKLSQFSLYTGPNNTVDIAGNAIAGGWFDFGDANIPIVIIAEPDFITDHFVFYADPETAIIDNGTSREVILHLWFDPAYLVDESVLQFMIKADPHGFVSECTNSQFAGTLSADVVGGSLIIDTNVGVKDVSESHVKVYPNPADNVLFVKSSEIISDISITDVLGRNIETINVNSDFSEINIANFTKGVYFIRINTENESYIIKSFIKK